VQVLFSIFIVLLMIYILYRFLNTEYGQALRGTGDNEAMMRSVGVDTNKMKVIGLALSNSLVAFSGAMIAQYQRFADISMGIGMIIAGLASVIIGEVLLGIKSIQGKLCAVVAGSIVYRFVIALVLEIDFIRVTDLKLFTAILVIIALISPRLKQSYNRRAAIKKSNGEQAVRR
jgi:putative ABC transport system permease protein